jgi:hypothetical protein
MLGRKLSVTVSFFSVSDIEAPTLAGAQAGSDVAVTFPVAL